MQKQFWDEQATVFDREILNVFDQDHEGVISSCVERHLANKAAIGDFGCGVGWGIPMLSSCAGRVFAVDISGRALKRAKRNCRQYGNVEYLQCDLASAPPQTPVLDAVVAVNVLITPNKRIRTQILTNAWHALNCKGTLLLVVPSFESQLWGYQNLVQYKTSKAGKRKRALRKVRRLVRNEVKSISDGTIRLSEVDTKFFLAPEIENALSESGFTIVDRKSVEYNWEEELLPRTWPRRPRPWHWLVVAQKRAE